MSDIILCKIDVTKIVKERLFKGQKGTYLDCTLLPNKNGDDQYGNSHMIVQSVSKEERADGKRGAIIGNAKTLTRDRGGRPAEASPPAKPTPADDDTGDDAPF